MGNTYTVYQGTNSHGDWVYRGILYNMMVFTSSTQSGAVLNIPVTEGTFTPESPWRVILVSNNTD